MATASIILPRKLGDKLKEKAVEDLVEQYQTLSEKYLRACQEIS